MRRVTGSRWGRQAAVFGWLCASVASAAVLKQVHHGVATMPALGTTLEQTVTVPLSVDLARSFSAITYRVGDGDPSSGTVRHRLTPTGLELTRGDSVVGAATVEWSVVEFASGAQVQRGTLPVINDTTVPLAPVDVARSFAQVSCLQTTVAGAYDDNDFIRAVLVNPTTLSLNHNRGAGSETECHWQVVELDGVRVQRGAGTLTAGALNSAVGLAQAVDPTASWVLLSWRGTAYGVARNLLRATLGATAVDVSRQSSLDAVEFAFEVVSFEDGTGVQHGNVAMGAAELAQDAPMVAPATPAYTLPRLHPVWSTGVTTADANRLGPALATLTLQADGGQLHFERATTGSAPAEFAWQLVTFNADAGSGPDAGSPPADGGTPGATDDAGSPTDGGPASLDPSEGSTPPGLTPDPSGSDLAEPVKLWVGCGSTGGSGPWLAAWGLGALLLSRRRRRY